MKYIRTKDYGVCRVIDEDKHTLSYENSDVVGCLWKDDYKDKIQYADTIEELCEYFLVFDDDNYCYVTENYTDFINMYVDFERHNCLKEAFGCIKTDKGLIYVAKMNEEGELELL